jgi:hypothetical protein
VPIACYSEGWVQCPSGEEPGYAQRLGRSIRISQISVGVDGPMIPFERFGGQLQPMNRQADGLCQGARFDSLSTVADEGRRLYAGPDAIRRSRPHRLFRDGVRFGSVT